MRRTLCALLMTGVWAECRHSKGSKGIQIYVPTTIRTSVNYDGVKGVERAYDTSAAINV